MHKAIHLQTIDRQWAATAVKQNYFRFVTLVISFIHNQLSHTVRIHTVRFVIAEAIK